MPVYVDDMRADYGRMKMCHMIADTKEELLAMAGRIGLSMRWLQKEGTSHEHFDVCLSRRKLAVSAGAIEITQKELGRMLHARRVPLQCIALDWKRTPEGMDYVPCDGSEAVPCQIEGLLLTVPAALCIAHQKAFHKTGADIRLVGQKDGHLIHRKWGKD
jgi:hypothetical protein